MDWQSIAWGALALAGLEALLSSTKSSGTLKNLGGLAQAPAKAAAWLIDPTVPAIPSSTASTASAVTGTTSTPATPATTPATSTTSSPGTWTQGQAPLNPNLTT